jgi:hypothetical protein
MQVEQILPTLNYSFFFASPQIHYHAIISALAAVLKVLSNF